ncbi:MAG: DUF3887 domain-containing protein [Synechococcaceae cyanobacterium]|nr:DUF3887 domain-containing protein [Synechococcaceae cyanobacterium]
MLRTLAFALLAGAASTLPLPHAATALPAAVGESAAYRSSLLAQAAPSGRAFEPSSAVVEERTRVAAEQVLQQLRSGTAESRFAQFAPDIQRITSPERVQSKIERQPRVISWTITDIEPGVESSTVSVNLQTAAGKRELMLVLDQNGKVKGYHFNVADQKAEAVVRQFMEALTRGRYLDASGYLSTRLQAEIPPSTLQTKWQRLQRVTGDFQQIRRIYPSETNESMKLVLVNTQFSRLSDNLYVILDPQNEIIGVDFPSDAGPAGELR